MGEPNMVCRGGCGRLGPASSDAWAWADDQGNPRGVEKWPWCAECLPARRARGLEERARRVGKPCQHRGVLPRGRACPETDEPLEQWCDNCLTYRRALRELTEATAAMREALDTIVEDGDKGYGWEHLRAVATGEDA